MILEFIGNEGFFSLLDSNGAAYVNHDQATVVLRASSNDSIFIVPNGTVEILEGRLAGLRLGYMKRKNSARES